MVRQFKLVLRRISQEETEILLAPSDGEPVSLELARKVARGTIRELAHRGHPIEVTVYEEEAVCNGSLEIS